MTTTPGWRMALGTVPVALLVSLALGSGPAAGQEIDVSRLGPQVGERIPDFAKSDQNGDQHTLASIMGPNGAVFVLSRSADW